MDAEMRPGETVYTSFNAGEQPRLAVRAAGRGLAVERDGTVLATLLCEDESRRLAFRPGAAEPVTLVHAALAGLEAFFALHPDRATVGLASMDWAPVADTLLGRGAALAGPGGMLTARASLLWQLPELWLPSPTAPYPQHLVMTGERRHPLRPMKPTGMVYARFIPWLGGVLSLRAATVEADAARLNRWMNDPRVAAVWAEEGDLDKHRAYLGGLIADPHMLPLIVSFNGEPFGYFEVYWAKENRLGPFYDAQDYDRGWHVLIGEDSFRGRPWVTAWLPSLMHYIFLDDCRTERIVGEPRADHQQQIRNLDKAGFAKIKEFDFPHKRALLVMLLRERFFGDRLWQPAVAPAAARQGVRSPSPPRHDRHTTSGR
ncbi:Protein N-acetyltransferase, RimJ/RimL family [Chelatococcus sambhunathii]|uniref:Protein N-acetyltransferase, RimJ/RimL family n=1 Tax=Chelatococcus sambhunathii TaxID=363953 RepID=A0ABM9U3U7_9HYPH|nr:GNAT family N-acetyltransferase [Chelatococcus sambhunathii]CUA87636.1 Protein N-acetyltransferase, RimJ/RimL family [Chelatococcus sambhunathii]